MRRIRELAVAVLMAGCGGEDVPSCQIAWQHFYDSGCELQDTNGQAFAVADVIQNCKQLRAAAPDQCIDDLDNLQSCVGGVPAGASNGQCAACSDEQDALFTCE